MDGLSPNTSDKIEQIILQLSGKEAEQQQKREKCSQIFDQILEYQNKLNDLRKEVGQTQELLHVLDDDIEELQKQRDRIMDGGNGGSQNISQTRYPRNLTQSQWDVKEEKNEADPGTGLGEGEGEERVSSHRQRNTLALEMEHEHTRGNFNDNDEDNFDVDYEDVEDHYADLDEPPQTEPPQDFEDVDGSSSSNHNENAHSFASRTHNGVNSNHGNDRNGADNMTGGTLDRYFGISPRKPAAQPQPQHQQMATSSSSSSSIFPPRLQQHFNTNNNINSNNNPYQQQRGFQSRRRKPSAQERNQEYLQSLSSDNFPWSQHLQHELKNTFQIQKFRGHQKEIINCTMSGDDVFVIMRTGGGKSLTYQLPALFEGKSQERKITLVISPLLSLIRDQEEQMNAFSRGTATSFTSGLGSAEQTRRWNLLRDPNSGLCLVLVTPERVYKSNKLRSELEKLNQQNRLGRFVVDECHCATQWGHDFRPDYTKLGILKQHFPNVPLIAVTATASDRVREDCCNILGLGTNYQFFRSSANRPNLKYSIKVKPDKPDDIVEAMADFIQEHHPRNAGIIYCFSKREANNVAEKLTNFGITAKAYHAEVSTTAKDSIHRSWMNNRTQVVVATIAFGLGINKPDVRFVIHHSLSKTLEAYYQESGRAGRDGKEADCVLYYSPKDVCRTLGMIHGERSEVSFWSMARYAQTHGDDSVCKRFILSTLGEPGSDNIEDVIKSCGEEIEVGKFVQDCVRMIHLSNKDLTMAQIIGVWRTKGKDTPDFMKENPPNSVLTKNECERILVSLMIADVLFPNVKFTTYNNIVYIGLKPRAMEMLNKVPKVKIRFPIRDRTETPTSSKKKSNSKEGGNGWISKKKTTAKKTTKKRAPKTKTTKRKSKSSTGKKSKSSKKSTTTRTRKPRVSDSSLEVINILDDSSDEDGDDDDEFQSHVQGFAKRAKVSHSDSILLDDLESDSSENEFE